MKVTLRSLAIWCQRLEICKIWMLIDTASFLSVEQVKIKGTMVWWVKALYWIGRIPVQTPLVAQPGFGNQPRYEAREPRDLRVESKIKCKE